jgi:predicted dehydrogenase
VTARRLRVGLIGTGLIAQVMHLHYLAELGDRFEVAAVCDIAGDSARACAERYRIPAVFTDWRELIRHPLDAVLVLTSGSHAPAAEAAARAGRHVFVEKPMCFSVPEGRAMVAAAEEAGVTLMVGYPKRYDPAFVLLDTLVHELNTVRGLLGEPDRLDYVSLAEHSVTVMLRFGRLPAAIHWIDLPGIARYSMEFALYAPDRRVTLSFPSPFLRSEPAVLAIEGGEAGTARAWRTEETVSYESGFKAELVAFHDSAVSGTPPVTSGLDGLRDIALCQAIIESHRTGGPVDHPADPGGEGTAR